MSTSGSTIRQWSVLHWMGRAVWLVLTIAAYIWILFDHSFVWLRTAGIIVRYNYTIFIPLLVVGLFLLLRLQKSAGRLAAVTVYLLVFGFTLGGLWASGQSEAAVASGLIPWSDAATYATDAVRLLEGFSFSPFSSWRPMFPSLLAGLLGISGQNLQAALAVLVLLTALSVVFFARSVQQHLGAFVAAFASVILFLYYRRFSGTTLSENLGLMLAAAGFALLIGSAVRRRFGYALAGLFTVTLALCARPGPFFILPAIGLWILVFFRPVNLKPVIRIALFALAVITGFAVNSLLTSAISSSRTVPFANFTNAIYGVASGGARWTQLIDDHPDVMALPEPERTRRSLELVYEKISTRPELLLKGIAYNYRQFFSPSYYNAFSFVRGENDLVGEISRWGMYLLSILGVVFTLRHRSQPVGWLAVLGALGVLLSVPFVPPADAFGMRLYAAGIPLYALLPGLGVALLAGFLPKSELFLAPGGPSTLRPAWIYTCLLTLTLLTAPFFISRFPRSGIPQPPACPEGEVPVVFHLKEGSFVRVLREDAWQLDRKPNFHRGRFVRQIHNLPNIEAIEEFEKILDEVTLGYMVDLLSGESLLIVLPAPLAPAPGSTVRACGYFSPNPLVKPYNFFYITQTR